MFWKTLGTCALAIGFSASAASAGTIRIVDENNTVFIKSADLNSTVFGNANNPVLTTTALQSIHDDINDTNNSGTDKGVSTDNKVTIAAIDTSDGLGLFALFDDEDGVNGQKVSSDGDSLLVDSSVTRPTAGWINLQADPNDDATVITNSTQSGKDLVSDDNNLKPAKFQWADGRGDAFAWTKLQVDDTGDFTFILPESNAFQGKVQYVTYDGNDWKSVGDELSFTGTNTVSAQISFLVVPSPTAALAALPILGGIALRRRLRA